jgi:hypothetical protein
VGLLRRKVAQLCRLRSKDTQLGWGDQVLNQDRRWRVGREGTPPDVRFGLVEPDRAGYPGAGAKQERAMSPWLPEQPSTDFNGPMLYRGFSISAGQRIVETTGGQGVAGSILSSRRSTGPLT